jgi:hypothetical protein
MQNTNTEKRTLIKNLKENIGTENNQVIIKA